MLTANRLLASAIILRINGDVNGKTEIIEIERT